MTRQQDWWRNAPFKKMESAPLGEMILAITQNNVLTFVMLHCQAQKSWYKMWVAAPTAETMEKMRSSYDTV